MSVSQYFEDWGSENVVRVVLVNPNFEASLTKAVEELSATKLQLKAKLHSYNVWARMIQAEGPLQTTKQRDRTWNCTMLYESSCCRFL